VCTECDKHRDEITEHASQHIFNDIGATFAARRRRRRADAAMRQEPQPFRCASCNRDLPGAELGYVFALRNRATGEQVRFPHCERCLSGLDELGAPPPIEQYLAERNGEELIYQ
jgi:hypothetical protein